LTLVAPIAGTVLPPHRKLPAQKSGDLGPWSGTPIDPENLGSFLETGTQYCLIGDPGRLEAVLVIDQSDVEFIRPGQPVEIQMKQLPGTILRGAVGEVAQIDLKVTPPELLPLGIIPTQADEQGVPRPVGAVYQARVSFNAEGRQLLAGETGEAKIFAEPRSLARRLARVISRTMRFEL
jgi:putative peptide zinc metalloprotease protein